MIGLQLGFEYVDPARAEKNVVVKGISDDEWLDILSSRQRRHVKTSNETVRPRQLVTDKTPVLMHVSLM